MYHVQDYHVSKMYFPPSHTHQDITLSWHNCTFSPHQGSKPQCKDYTCSRTKVTVSRKTLIYPLSQQVEDAKLARQKTVWKERRDWGSWMLPWTTGPSPQTWHRVSVLIPQAPYAVPCPTSATSPSSLSPAAHILFSFVPTHPSVLPFPFLHAQPPRGSPCPLPLLGTSNRFSISFLRPYSCFPCSNCFLLCSQAHLHSDQHLVLFWVSA